MIETIEVGDEFEMEDFHIDPWDVWNEVNGGYVEDMDHNIVEVVELDLVV